MSHKVSISTIYLIILIASISLLTCEAQIRCRKFPYNGGMFGLISDSTLCQDFGHILKKSENQKIKIERRVSHLEIKHEVEVNKNNGTEHENSALKMKQDEPPIKTSIDQYSQKKNSSELALDPFMDILRSGKKAPVNKSWIGKLLDIK